MNTAAPQPSASPSVVSALLAMLEGPLADASYELVDIDCLGLGTVGATVRVLVELAITHPVGGRIDLDGVSEATRVVDELLETDTAVRLLPGRFTLEVSSPGLERPLRTPAHFRRAIGSTVTVKTKPGTPGERRVEGRLVDTAIDGDETDSGIRIGDRTIAYADIEKARIVVNWGPAPKPGAGSPRKPHPMAVKAAAAAALASGATVHDSDEDVDLDDEFDDDEEFDDDDDDDDELNAFDDVESDDDEIDAFDDVSVVDETPSDTPHPAPQGDDR